MILELDESFGDFFKSFSFKFSLQRLTLEIHYVTYRNAGFFKKNSS